MRKIILFIFILLLTISFNAKSDIVTPAYVDTLHNWTKTTRFLKVYDEMNFTVLVDATEYENNLKKNWIKFGDHIISTSDAGKNWDTLYSWYFSYTGYIEEYAKVREILYFDKNTIGILFANGMYFSNDLLNNKTDTFRLIDADLAKEINVVRFSKTNDSTAALSSTKEDYFHFTTDRGKTWERKSKPLMHEGSELKTYSLALHPSNQQIFQIFGRNATNEHGYNPSYFDFNAFLYNTSDALVSRIYSFGKEAAFGHPLFLNDSIVLIPGHKAYFYDDSMHTDSVFSKPVIYRVSLNGFTYTKVFESEYFIGRNSQVLNKYGDTLCMSYLTGALADGSQRYGLVYSTDQGETWHIKDLSYLKPKGSYIVGVNVLSPTSGFWGLEQGRNIMIYKYNIDNLTSIEDEENFFHPSAKIYPNPAVDYLTIEFDNISFFPENIEIIDLLGNKKNGVQIYKTNGSIMLNTSNLSAGMYYLSATSGNTILNKSFVISR